MIETFLAVPDKFLMLFLTAGGMIMVMLHFVLEAFEYGERMSKKLKGGEMLDVWENRRKEVD